MNERQRFYQERDRRTREYGLDTDPFDRPVFINVGPETASSPGGQSMVLALVNMVARLHRTVRIDIPAVPLSVVPLRGGGDLMDAAARLARAIDPFIELQVAGPGRSAASLGVGAGALPGLDWYVGAAGNLAVLSREHFPLAGGPRLSPAAGIGACLGAMALCRTVLGERVRDGMVDAWGLSEPDVIPTVPQEVAVTGPIDVGSVLVVGAGGVGSSFAYWAREFGVRGEWSFVDGDTTELHNTNRCLGLFAADAGWPLGSPRLKADAAASLVGGKSIPRFYDEADAGQLTAEVVLPLANERNVRLVVGQRGEPFLMHATTSAQWEAQLHRHIPGRDDCIACRLPARSASAQLRCATGRVEAREGRSFDAALPFLSASAGLMLAIGLLRLQHGVLTDGRCNQWALCLRGAHRYTRRSVSSCSQSCVRGLPPGARLAVHKARRWSRIDAEAWGVAAD